MSDTARWVAVYRAQESERPDRLFDDRFARGLAGPRGEAIVRGLPRGRQMAWPMVVRTAVMDEIILRVIGRDLASPVLLKMMARSWGPVLQAGNAPFRFGPAESTGFFAPYGWREVEWRSQMTEGLRLKRIFPMARFWTVLGRLAPKTRQEEFRRFAGIALLDRMPP